MSSHPTSHDGERTPETRTAPDFHKFNVRDSFSNPITKNTPPGAAHRRLSRQQLEAALAGLNERDAQIIVSIQRFRYPFMLANLDGVCDVPDVGPCIFEAKTASAYKAAEWDDAIPDEYALQLQHYMAVTGYLHSVHCWQFFIDSADAGRRGDLFLRPVCSGAQQIQHIVQVDQRLVPSPNHR